MFGLSRFGDSFRWNGTFILSTFFTSLIEGCADERRGLSKVGKGFQPVHGQISQIVQTPTSASSITPTYSPIFSGVPDRFSAVQYNSLVVDRSNLPRDLVVTAESQNGEIMGLAAIGKPLWGVQFHPEVRPSTIRIYVDTDEGLMTVSFSYNLLVDLFDLWIPNHRQLPSTEPRTLGPYRPPIFIDFATL